MPNAIDLLKADHHEVQALLAAVAETADQTVDTCQRLLTEINRILRIHVQIEEEIFYPALEASAKNQSRQSVTHEGVEEFWGIEKLVLPDLEQTALGAAEFTGWVSVLRELVARHIDEEQDTFAAARELLSHGELEALGETMEVRKQELLHSS